MGPRPEYRLEIIPREYPTLRGSWPGTCCDSAGETLIPTNGRDPIPPHSSGHFLAALQVDTVLKWADGDTCLSLRSGSLAHPFVAETVRTKPTYRQALRHQDAQEEHWKWRLMYIKIAFAWRCPKGHNVDDSMPKTELKDQLVAGRLTARCPHCGGQEYAIPAEQRERILKQLSI